jgi:hypothetical protein
VLHSRTITAFFGNLGACCRYHHGRRWTDKFQHVVGVMHTNYLDYARREEKGHIKEALLRCARCNSTFVCTESVVDVDSGCSAYVLTTCDRGAADVRAQACVSPLRFS